LTRGSGTRSVETLLRYRGAEFTRALRTLKALQAASAPRRKVSPRLSPNEPERLMKYLPPDPMAGPALHEPPASPIPNEPERRPLNEYVIPDQPGRGRMLHEPAACWAPDEPEPAPDRRSAGGVPHASLGRMK
jgi:hypothetical protein